ncbi:hypothetical protein M8818_001305 [Zalaria obscura]|uniref:Uncharacterized protein n=1 Tax=Zalaria obscura TaxID=2024903 RepID=A0ACC3SL62_9PEZI
MSRPSTSLSAAAPAFSPSSPDAFAQTGAQQDDLFSGDVQYAPESMETRPIDNLFDDDFTPVAHPVVETQPSISIRGRAARGGRGANGRGRGRGRGNGQFGRDVAPPVQPQSQSQSQSQQADTPAPTEQKPSPAPAPAPIPSLQASQHAPPSLQQSQPAAPTQPSAPSQQPQPSARSPAVRGDRLPTGGIRKPKLSEAELAAKMSAISLKNASLTAAHERAEADAASFAAREEEAKVRRRREGKERAVMEGERERNRLRKLKAQGGREWDAEKEGVEEERRGVGRGAYGGVVGARREGRGGFAGDREDYSDGREYIYRENRGRGRGRGRGGQRGAGRGGIGGRDGGNGPSQPAPAPSEFPELPGAQSKPVDEAAAEAPKVSFPAKTKQPAEQQANLGASDGARDALEQDAITAAPPAGKSWADMME